MNLTRRGFLKAVAAVPLVTVLPKLEAAPHQYVDGRVLKFNPAHTNTGSSMRGCAKAWVTFDSRTVEIKNSYGVKGITKNGIGNYTVIFDEPAARPTVRLQVRAGMALVEENKTDMVLAVSTLDDTVFLTGHR